MFTSYLDQTAYLDQAVAELMRLNPRRARVFDRFGIDYRCGANIPLAQACQEAGVAIGEVCDELDECDALVIFSHEVDWSMAPHAEYSGRLEPVHVD
jgi:regulator of cell morphogenesis and NO signaling